MLAKLSAVFRVPGFPALVVTVFLLGLAHALTLPYLSLFALTEAGLRPAQFGVYTVVSALSGVVATTWLGRLSDHGLGRKQAIVVALVFAGVGYATLVVLRGFPALLLNATLLLSVGRAAYPLSFAFARARFEAEAVRDMPLATSTLRMFFSLAWVLGPALGALVLARSGFRGLFASTAAAFALTIALILPAGRVAGTLASSPRTAVWPYLRQRPVAALMVGFGLLFLCSSMNLTLFPLYVTGPLHGTTTEVGWLLGLAAGLELPLMLGCALVAHRLGTGRLMLAATVIYAVYFALLAAARGTALLYPAQLLTAVVISVVMGLGMSYFQDLLPGEPGLATALYANAMTLGTVLSGSVFAALAGPIGLRGLLLTCAACCLLSLALLSYGHRRLMARRR